jgi:hypothetical protein
MPRLRSNLNLLSVMQDEYDAQQAESGRAESLALREQGLEEREGRDDQSMALREQQDQLREAMEGYTEAHQQQMADIAQKTAELHDAFISNELQKQQTQIEQQTEQLSQTSAAWKAVGDLNPNTPDYPAKVAAIGSTYPAAFAKAEDGTENGLLSHVTDLDKVHETWSTMTQKSADEQARLAYGGGPQKEKYAAILGNLAQFKSAADAETNASTKAGYTSQYQGALAEQAEFQRQFPGITTPQGAGGAGGAGGTGNPAASPTPSGDVFEYDPATKTRKPVDAGSQVP